MNVPVDRISMLLVVATGLLAMIGYLLAFQTRPDREGIGQYLAPGVAIVVALALLVGVWFALDRMD